MGTLRHKGFGALALAVALATSASPALAHDRPALRNGGFETGDFTAWQTDTRTFDPGGPDGWRVLAGTRTPLSGFTIPAPPQGRFQAVVDQRGPGSHVLFRDIAVDDDDLRLRLTVWYRNRNVDFFTPRTLGFQRVPNQQLRIDLIRPGARLRSMDPDDILATVFRTRVGDPAQIAPRVVRFDLSRFEDRTVRLRIAEVDNQFFFHVGIDAVRVVEVEHDDADGSAGTGADPSATSTQLVTSPSGTARYVR